MKKTKTETKLLKTIRKWEDPCDELLAALKEMVEQFGHYCEHTEDAKEIETLIKACAAIAKAEGVK
jgi:hypothetical protein